MEQTLNIETVPATEEAARQVMTWRNDPDTLGSSIHSNAKEWPRFYSEFIEEYVSDPQLPCLFLLLNGKRVAFVRFRRLSDLIEKQSACDISLIVAPEERGKGLITKRVMERCLEVPRDAGIGIVVADIKPANARSISLFQKSGFTYFSEFDHPVNDENRTVKLKRFVYHTCEIQQSVELKV